MKETGRKGNILQIRLLPKLAWKGIASNGNVYYPYLAAGIFSVFTYFVFASVLQNDISRMFPKWQYVCVMMDLGKILLSFILLLFLIYANSFLVKRRRKEFGLYHILGLEKKHIGAMMLFESFLLYCGALSGGIIFGVVLSKLLFLFLLKICRLPMDLQFVFAPAAFRETLVYFGVVYLVNFLNSLWQVGKARPIELMSGSRKGEKEPKFLWIYAFAGVVALVRGYYLSITSELDSEIFTNFFMAVFLVIIGTYLLFTSGSITFLKWKKTRKKSYYRPENFITISGMLYRMKKSAASLSNICIFSTMTLITFICTIALGIGMDGALSFIEPYDLTLTYNGEKVLQQDIMQEIGNLEEKYGLTVQRADNYNLMTLAVKKQENAFIMQDGKDYEQEYDLDLLLQDDYNRVADRSVSLGEDEVLIYCNGKDFGYDSVLFFGKEFRVQEEPDEFYPYPKADQNEFEARYMMVVGDRQARDACVGEWCRVHGVEDTEGFIQESGKWIVQVLLNENVF
ncbi:MAG: FtsX-like permease family protein [Eubacterium sp.]|nr:FtsX-like permease family protein [Eubacterium sp.]